MINNSVNINIVVQPNKIHQGEVARIQCSEKVAESSLDECVV